MNIGLITFSLNSRSGSRAPIRLAQFLNKKGHKITIYSYDILYDKEVHHSLEKDGIKVYIYSPGRKLPFPLLGIFSIKKIINDLRKNRHEVLSFHSNLPFLLACKLSGTKILATYYGTEFSYSKIREEAGLSLSTRFDNTLTAKINDFVLTILQKLYFFMAKNAVAISKFLALEAKKFFNKEIPVIYLGAETDFFKPGVEVSEDNYILSVSRIVPYKGFDLLIEAFKKANEEVPNLKLIIVGSTANQDYLTYLHSLSNEKVEIKSNLSDAELQKLYSNCLMYATCDLWVPWSLTPLEASYFEKPILALNQGAMKEIVTNGENGYLAENIEDLSAKIIKVALDETLRKTLGRKAKKLVDRFRWEKTADEYTQILEKVARS